MCTKAVITRVSACRRLDLYCGTQVCVCARRVLHRCVCFAQVCMCVLHMSVHVCSAQVCVLHRSLCACVCVLHWCACACVFCTGVRVCVLHSCVCVCSAQVCVCMCVCSAQVCMCLAGCLWRREAEGRPSGFPRLGLFKDRVPGALRSCFLKPHPVRPCLPSFQKFFSCFL